MLRKVFGRLAKRWAWVETAIQVQERFGEVHGGYLASAITLASFTSIFPLLLLATAVVGWMAFRDADVAGEIIATLGMPADGDAAKALVQAVETAEKSRRVAGPIGAAGLLWSGLGVVAAVQYAFDNVWQVQGRGLRDKLRGLVWLMGSAALILISFGMTAALNYIPVAIPVALIVGVALGVGLWMWTLRWLTNVSVPWRALAPGALLGALGFEVLKAVASVYVPRVVSSSSALYGSIGVVFAILAWLFIFGRLAVYASVLNVVRWEERHGTVTAEIELPRHPDLVTLEATRSGEAKPAAN